MATFVVLAFCFLGIENGRLKLVDRTGFREDVEVSTTSERNSKGEIVKTVETRKVVSGKTFWDLLSLAGVPTALAVLGFVLQSSQQKQADKAAELQQQQVNEAAKEEVLQAYFDRLSELLVDKNIVALAVKQQKASEDPSAEKLTEEQEELLNAAKDVIRARTLSILRRLNGDGARKGSVIRFLVETELIGKLQLDLRQADLSGAILKEADLDGANLRQADLSGVKFIYTNLNGADLQCANLSHASISYGELRNVDLLGSDLSGAILDDLKLTHTDLSHADLSGSEIYATDLTGADLSCANLSRAKLMRVDLSKTKLDQAIFFGNDLSDAVVLPEELLEERAGLGYPYLCKVKLPTVSKINPNRDCYQLAELLTRYSPDKFKTIKDAQRYLDEDQ
ncbi:pentapeptide repeat-containing protein [Leptolyngbya ohadii]|uniref:pentapeptide repeat-containing protein n=1 Tax=Leptolyngbya ohadii TaxID=1962290 RepID=UPI0015C5CB64|nr:pentapeptide repeat-containing protein [Leptolyngbya ohadii]